MLGLILLLAAPALEPGLWEQRNDPGAASLAGRPLNDLPLDAIKADRICLTPADAADPAKWLSRDTAADCTLTRSAVAKGLVDIAGTCQAEEGRKPGTVTLTGRYERDAFDIAFSTTTDTAQGSMAFSGRMRGRRVGACDGGAAR